MLKRLLMSIRSIDFNVILIFYFCALIGLAVFCRYFIYYILLWIFIGLAYLFLVRDAEKSWLCDRFYKIGPLRLMVILFVLSITLRLIFLVQKPFLSTDLEHLYVVRSQLMLDGNVPYRDFDVNKPPLYAYLLYFVGLSLGAGQIQFRIFFSAIDSLIPMVIFLIGSYLWNKKFGIVAALAYVFCPIPLLEIGISGHYDSVPVLFVMISLLFLLREKPALSGLSLGLAFAFKIYPIVLFPFYLIWFKSRKQRVNYAIAFPIPMILSIIPTLIIYPSGLLDYLTYQTVEWQAWGLISGPLVSFFGASMLGVKTTNLVLFVFLFLILVLFYLTATKKKPYNLWVKLIILVFVFIEVLAVLRLFEDALSTVLIAAVIIISMILIALAYIPLSKFLDPYLSISITPKDDLLIQSVFAVLLLVIGSAQAHAWYLIWLLPFVCLIRTKDLKWFFLILLLVMYPIEYLAHPEWFSGMMYP